MSKIFITIVIFIAISNAVDGSSVNRNELTLGNYFDEIIKNSKLARNADVECVKGKIKLLRNGDKIVELDSRSRLILITIIICSKPHWEKELNTNLIVTPQVQICIKYELFKLDPCSDIFNNYEKTFLAGIGFICNIYDYGRIILKNAVPKPMMELENKLNLKCDKDDPVKKYFLTAILIKMEADEGKKAAMKQKLINQIETQIEFYF